MKKTMKKAFFIVVLAFSLLTGFSALSNPIDCDLLGGLCTRDYTQCVSNGGSGTECAKAYNNCMKVCQNPLPIPGLEED